MTIVYVGTSGWSYDWNPDGFDWYVANSKLNSVELNASFYRFPFPNMVSSWSRKTPEGFRWAIKVNRLITHIFRFNEKAILNWKKFKAIFKPLDARVDFYLFQLPPSATPKPSFLQRLETFISEANLGARFALEYRNQQWFKQDLTKWAEKLGITVVSLDSPDFPTDIFNVNGQVYVRMHGKTAWYSHCYDESELSDMAKAIKKANPEKAYVYFNNNHDMLNNAQKMLEITSKLGFKIPQSEVP